jgi:hypothetical protein
MSLYSKDKYDSILNVKCGDLIIMVARSPNKQIRSVVSIANHAGLEDAYGFIVTPMNTKMCKLKKLNGSTFLEKKKTPGFRRESYNYFYTIDNDTQKHNTKLEKIKSY